ncbi:MAG: HlyD family efflux transporter periplasmic adaptor subunit [Candidatus Latescibacterota bacterium]
MMVRKLKYVLIVTGALLGLLILARVTRWQYTIRGPCRLVAQKEWSLIQVESDKLLSRLVTNSPYMRTDFYLRQFDRPDFVRFSLTPKIQEGALVRQGEVIGTLGSLDNESQWARLQAELDRSRANLRLLLGGEKAEVQDEARRALDYAKAQRDVFEPTLRRSQQLYEKQLISPDEMERAEATSRLLELKILVADARLKTAQSRATPEEIDVAKAGILSVKRQMEAAQAKLNAGQISVPIEGLITSPYSGDTLCTVIKVDTLIAQIPVDERQIHYLRIGSAAQVNVSGLGSRPFVGQIVSIGQSAQPIHGRAMFIVTGSIANPDLQMRPGMTGFARIYCDKVSWPTLLKRWWRASLGTRLIAW